MSIRVFLVSIGNKNVMFDCGMHMGYNDERRFPDFNYITGGTGTLTPHIDAVVISWGLANLECHLNETDFKLNISKNCFS